MTGEAVVVDCIRSRARGECPVAVRQVDRDRFQLERCGGARGERRERSAQEHGNECPEHGQSSQAAMTSTDSMTLRMKPAGFQLGVSGWASPLVFVQRTIKVYLPAYGSVIRGSHCRKPYFPASFPSLVAVQDLAASLEMSTFATPQQP